MEAGYETLVVGPGLYSATVEAPADSSILQIFADGSQEYQSPNRARFIRQSVYNVYTVASHDQPNDFDTIVLSNASRSLTTLPVAQVRSVNLIPDTSISFDIRIGCPNGEALSKNPTRFKAASLYSELPPGPNVFSISEVSTSGSRLVGTYQAILKEFTPYTILLYRIAGSNDIQMALFDEANFTTDAASSLIPVLMRDADMRVANVNGSPITVTLSRTGQTIVSSLSNAQLGAYALVPTCEQEAADIVEATFADGSTAIDSTSLTVRGAYTVIGTRDTSGASAVVIVPPADPVFGRAGKAVIRVVNASTYSSGVAVSVGARTDLEAGNNVSSGVTLTQRLNFDEITGGIALTPGELPITVSTTTNPTTLLGIRRANLLPDHDYLLLVADGENEAIQTYLLDEQDSPGALNEIERAAFMRVVDGSPFTSSVSATIGTVVENATVYYRNSLSTSVQLGTVPVNVNGATNNVSTSDGKRSLEIHTTNNGSNVVVDITTDPLKQELGLSQRRVINVTADIPLISVAYDTSYRSDPETPHVARNVPFGEASAIHELRLARRGTMYVYNSDTLEELYRLPIDLGPLGNSYSLIVVGGKDQGYEAIVLQEF